MDVGTRSATASGKSDTRVDSTWKIVRLRTDEAQPRRLNLLRPLAWLHSYDLAINVRLQLQLGPTDSPWTTAEVQSIEDYAGPPPGPGRIVLATVESHSDDVWRLELIDDAYRTASKLPISNLRVTGNHPLYSLDRRDWVEARDLRPGERLQTAAAAVRVQALERERASVPVVNLSVEGDHEYFAGDAEVLSHNCEVFAAHRVEDGLQIGRRITTKQAVHRLMRGEDTYASAKQVAKRLQKKAGTRRPIEDPGHNVGYYPHFHDGNRANGHSFYGQPQADP